MFTSHAPYLAQNLADGKRLSVRQAMIGGTDGQEIKAIAVFNGFHLRFCIPVDDAIRIANDIADAVEQHDAA